MIVICILVIMIIVLYFPVDSNLSVDSNGVVYVGNTQGVVFALSSIGNLVWKVRADFGGGVVLSGVGGVVATSMALCALSCAVAVQQSTQRGHDPRHFAWNAPGCERTGAVRCQRLPYNPSTLAFFVCVLGCAADSRHRH